MSRIPFQPDPPEPRRPAPRYGEGAALVELGTGVMADFIRMGGQKCPLCGGSIASDDWMQEGRSITMACACEVDGCGFRCNATFRLIDAE